MPLTNKKDAPRDRQELMYKVSSHTWGKHKIIPSFTKQDRTCLHQCILSRLGAAWMNPAYCALRKGDSSFIKSNSLRKKSFAHENTIAKRSFHDTYLSSLKAFTTAPIVIPPEEGRCVCTLSASGTCDIQQTDQHTRTFVLLRYTARKDHLQRTQENPVANHSTHTFSNKTVAILQTNLWLNASSTPDHSPADLKLSVSWKTFLKREKNLCCKALKIVV